MKVVRSCETLEICNSTKQRRNPDDLNPRQKHICASASLKLLPLESRGIHTFVNDNHFNDREIIKVLHDASTATGATISPSAIG